MKGVIMAGGFGTRLRPLTFGLPKPMVPVANRPIMQRTVELLKHHGITDQLALLYFQPESIRNHFGDGKAFGVDMETLMRMQNAYDIAQAKRHLDDIDVAPYRGEPVEA